MSRPGLYGISTYTGMVAAGRNHHNSQIHGLLVIHGSCPKYMAVINPHKIRHTQRLLVTLVYTYMG